MRRLTLAVAALLLGAACTPEQAVWVHFYANGSPQLHAQAQRIVQCESEWNPRAVNPRSGTAGLFQLHPIHRAEFERSTGQPWSARFEPIWNAAYAKYLWAQTGDWRHWTCRP